MNGYEATTLQATMTPAQQELWDTIHDLKARRMDPTLTEAERNEIQYQIYRLSQDLRYSLRR